MRHIILTLAILLTACTVAREASLPDGTKGFVISKCKDLSYCYNRAAELCGGKYEVLNQNTKSEGVLGNGYGALETRQEITVRCPQ
jgi:hypothetical protein